MRDPNLSEMMAFLRSSFHGWGIEGDDDFKIAIHHFAERWYLGQGSNLYKAICEIDYNAKDAEPSEDVEEMVSALETEYAI